MSENSPTILLTGATGYVGGRLLPLLEARGERVRCLARQPQNLGNVFTLAAVQAARQ